MGASAETRSTFRRWPARLNLPAWVRRYPLIAFFALAYVLSWAWWLPLVIAGAVVDVGGWPTHFPGLLGPLLAGLAVAAPTAGRAGVADLLARLGRWRVGWGWWLIALSPLAFLALALPVARLLDGAWPPRADFGRFGGLPSIGPLGIWLLLVVVNGLGEEGGWRGFALPRLQARFGPLAAPLLLALPWALWHLPLFAVLASFRGFGPGTLGGFFLGLACGSVVLAWLCTRAGGSVLLPAVWHGTYNLASATLAARGTVAAVVSTLVMVQAVALLFLEWRARRRAAPSVLGPRPIRRE